MTDFHLYAQNWNDQVISGERYTARKNLITGAFAYEWWPHDKVADPIVGDLLDRIRTAIVDSDFMEVGRQGLTYWGRIDTEAGLLLTMCVRLQTIGWTVEATADMNDPEFNEMLSGLSEAAALTMRTYDFLAMKDRLEVLLDAIDPLVVMVEAHNTYVTT